MQENNTRRRTSSAQGAAGSSATSAQPGRVGRMFQEEEKRVEDKMEKGYMPFRYFLGKGEQCEITILDASLEDAFVRPEHNLKGSDGKYGNIVPCVRNEVDCPVCKSDRDSTIVLYLSALVHRPYTLKKTGEVREYSKMFLCIKRQQYSDFARIEKAAKKLHGTLRGVTILLARGKDPNSPSIGAPIAGEDGNLIVDFYSEADLKKEFGHKAIKAREGDKIIKPENDDITPYDYRRLMPEVNVDDFLAEYGNGPAPGSRKAVQDYRDSGGGEDGEEGGSVEAGGGGRRRRGAAAAVEPEAEQPAQGRRRRTAPGAVAVETEVLPPEEPRAARRARAVTTAAAPQTTGRTAAVDPEGADGDDDIPFGD